MNGKTLFERMSAIARGDGKTAGPRAADMLEKAHTIRGGNELPRPGAAKELQRPE